MNPGKKLINLLLLLLFTTVVNAQTNSFDPQKAERNPLHGQKWQDEERSNFYNRFPDRLKPKVPESFWGLCKHSAGISIKFYSNSPTIKVKYCVDPKNEVGYNHMPATGVSGVDLFATDSEGNKVWFAATREFSDTIKYNYNGIIYNSNIDKTYGYEYRLFLPAYNMVSWLNIEVAQDSKFEWIYPSKEKPIVAYGTSITQGACASRPGMMWTSILSRRFDRDFINMGFSGSGTLEPIMLDLMAEIDAKVYILDCMPNLQDMEYNALVDRIIKGVEQLRKLRPTTPIILTEHLGYPHKYGIKGFAEKEENANKATAAAFKILLDKGYKDLYTLTYDEIGIGVEDTVEAGHPSDVGMIKYADAYEPLLRKIMAEPKGKIVTTRPVSQRREPMVYEWKNRHEQILTENETKTYKGAILGNSITHYWGGVEGVKIARAPESYNQKLKDVHNLGYGWDRIENVLWRVYHDELDSPQLERVIISIGTNNISSNHTDNEIVDGIANLIEAIKARQPKARVVVLGIYPRRATEDKIIRLNKLIKEKAISQGVEFQDPGSKLLKGNKIDESLFSDGLHPNAAGYSLIEIK